MTSSNTSVLMVEGAPQNGCCQYLGPQGKFNHIPPLQKTFQDQQVGLAQASFKLTASALGPRVGGILCVSLKSGVSISHSPLRLLKVSPADVQRQTSRGSSSRAGPPDWVA